MQGGVCVVLCISPSPRCLLKARAGVDSTKFYLCWQTSAGDSVSLSAVPDNTESPICHPGALEHAAKAAAAGKGLPGGGRGMDKPVTLGKRIMLS